MNRNFLSSLLLLFVAVIMVTSCGNETNTTTNTDTIVKDTVQDMTMETNTSYRLPSPIELYAFLKNNKAKYDKDILNSVDNLSKYFSVRSKALNFGIYASDLAYSTVFEEPQKTFFYYKAVKQLADEMGLTEGFDQSITKRINDNINNTDSLYRITSDAYFVATSHLEEKGKKDLLNLIIAGGWVESIHIAYNSVGKFSADSKIVKRIVDQRLLLENLVELLRSLPQNAENQALIEKFEDLQVAYMDLDSNANVLITEAQYNKIKQKVQNIRNEFIK